MVVGALRINSRRNLRKRNSSHQSRLTRVLSKNNIPLLVIDHDSMPFLMGAELDFEDHIHRKGFVVNSNPNALSTCSCKKSFAPNDAVFEKLFDGAKG